MKRIPRYRRPVLRKTACLVPVRAASGVIIGKIVLAANGERVFRRNISERHRPRVLFKTLDAWPLGDYALRQLEQWHASRLRYETPEGVYECSLIEFLERAVPLDFPHERQWVLPRAQWSLRPENASASPKGDTQHSNLVEQTDLFGTAP